MKLAALIFFVLPGFLFGQGKLAVPAPVAPTALTEQTASALIVMVECQAGEAKSSGAGIIFGFNRSDDRLYIATANHVVSGCDPKTVRVQFHWLRGEWFEANRLSTAETQTDLAVLGLVGLRAKSISVARVPFRSLGDPKQLNRRDGLYAIGYPGGRVWYPNLTPFRVSEVAALTIRFEANSIARGNSGGGLFNERWELVGMVRLDEPPDAEAVRIDAILDRLARWGYPCNLEAAAFSSQTGRDSEPTSSGTVPVARTVIRNFRVSQAGNAEVEFTVDYNLGGDFFKADTIFIRGYPARSDGQPYDSGFSGRGIRLDGKVGTATLQIKKTALDPVEFPSPAVQVCIYPTRKRGEPDQGRVCEVFPYQKTWTGHLPLSGDRPPAPNRIGSFAAAHISSSELEIKVRYSYSGELGAEDSVRFSVLVVGADGRQVPISMPTPPRVAVGSGTATMRLTRRASESPAVTSSAIEVCIAEAPAVRSATPLRRFCESFPYVKHWQGSAP